MIIIYSREESTARETEVIQEDAGWMTSRTGRGGHWQSVQLWPETGISGERRCECPWSPTLRNEEGIRQGKVMIMLERLLTICTPISLNIKKIEMMG